MSFLLKKKRNENVANLVKKSNRGHREGDELIQVSVK
jgi:hypothetical protein